MAASVKSEVITINEISVGHAEFLIIGQSPLIVNRVSEKAMRQLLNPPAKLNATQKATNLKHDPIAEFRSSPYLSESHEDPTYLLAPSMWFKNAMKSAALDLPGTNKTQIGRLCFVQGDYVPLWGIPELLMSVVRSADINRTPDIRTRVILREWAVVVPIQWVEPNLTLTGVTNLVSAGGTMSGVGDWRPQKGAGSFGQYRVLSDLEDPDFRRITTNGAYAAQTAAMDAPVAYDRETRELLAWYVDDVKDRGRSTTKSVEAK